MSSFLFNIIRYQYDVAYYFLSNQNFYDFKRWQVLFIYNIYSNSKTTLTLQIDFMSGKIENTLKMFSLNKEYLLIILSQEKDNKLLNLATEVVIEMILKDKNYQMYKLQIMILV